MTSTSDPMSVERLTEIRVLAGNASRVVSWIVVDLLSEVERLRAIESRPRTVGDLTARDLGRRVRIEFTEFTLDAMEYAGSLTGGPCLVMRSGERGWPNFDTPVEFLDDEPASGHQQPGERLPSPDQAAQVHIHPATEEQA